MEKRIIMVADQYPPIFGGTERQAEKLAHALAARGLPVTVLTPRMHGHWPAVEEEGLLRIERLSTLRGLFGIRGLRRYWQDLFARSLRRRLRELAPEIRLVHAHFMRRGAVESLAVGREFGFPVLAKETSSGPKNSFRSLPREYRGAWMVRRFREDLRHVVVLNQIAEAEYESLKFDDLTIHRAPNGLELSEAMPVWKGASKKRLLFLGRLRHEKGGAELLAAFLQLAPQNPEWILRFVGDGPEGDTLRALAEDAGLADRVEFPGRSDTPLRELAEASLFLLPSHTEGMSNALLEAMAVGIPAVATAVGANTEMLKGGAGWLAETPSIEHIQIALAQAMAAGPEEWQRRSALASGRIVERYQMDAVVDRYLEIYRHIGEAEK